MPLTNGRYGSLQGRSITARQRLGMRWRWLRHSVGLWLARPNRLAPGDTGAGTTLHREWGHWVIRPVSGWRSRRWITPPLHATRHVPASDRDGALYWGMDTLGL